VAAGRDLAGDGAPDLVVDDGRAIRVLGLSAGEVSLAEAPITLTGAEWAWPVGDVTGDGVADLLVRATTAAPALHLLPGPLRPGARDVGDLAGTALALDVGPSRGTVESVTVHGDLLGDGTDDVTLCVADRLRRESACALFTALAEARALSDARGAHLGYPGWVVGGSDLDEDGRADFVTLDVEDASRAQHLRVFDDLPTGDVGPERAWFDADLQGWNARAVALADLNGDGRRDLVLLLDATTEPNRSWVSVSYAPLAPVSGPLPLAHGLGSESRYTTGLTVGDFDGDGVDDLALSTEDRSFRDHRVHGVPGGAAKAR
jgi:hypothetical protein